ncbi:MAG: hypothetical protein ACREPJ_16180 [Rhodanobacteraceae bacterium]
MTNNTRHTTRIRGGILATCVGAAFVAAAGVGGMGTASAAPADLDCKLSYSLTGWAAIVKHAKGSGTVTCANGQSMPVRITVEGGGLTAGKWRIEDGKGSFTDVYRIDDVLGSYAEASANAGAGGAAGVAVLTKGPVSLALAGTGHGVNIGVSGAKVTISRAK